MNPKHLIKMSSLVREIRAIIGFHNPDGFVNTNKINDQNMDSFPVAHAGGYISKNFITFEDNYVGIGYTKVWVDRLLSEFDIFTYKKLIFHNRDERFFRCFFTHRNHNDTSCAEKRMCRSEATGFLNKRGLALCFDLNKIKDIQVVRDVYEFLESLERGEWECEYRIEDIDTYNKIVRMLREGSYGIFIDTLVEINHSELKLAKNVGLNCYIEAVRLKGDANLKRKCMLDSSDFGTLSLIESLRYFCDERRNTWEKGSVEAILDYMRSNPVKDPAS